MSSSWDYDSAFSRNFGLLSKEDQNVLRQSRIALAGLGGIGGLNFITLLRMGFEKFSVAEFDTFEVVNFNRQYGAFVDTIGRPKLDVMLEIGRKINPNIDIRIFDKGLDHTTCAEFLKDAACFIDSIDIFEIDVRHAIYEEAARQGIHAVFAAPIGMSSAWLVFSPTGMTFKEYFGVYPGQDLHEKFASFVIGTCPSATQAKYIDINSVSVDNRKGPSLSLSCQIAAGVTAAEVTKIILKRGKVKCVPHYQQFDAYTCTYKRGYIWGGIKNPWQKFKRNFVAKQLRELDRSRALASK